MLYTYARFSDLIPVTSSGEDDLLLFGVDMVGVRHGEGRVERGVRDSLFAKIDLYVSWIWNGLSSKKDRLDDCSRIFFSKSRFSATILSSAFSDSSAVSLSASIPVLPSGLDTEV